VTSKDDQLYWKPRTWDWKKLLAQAKKSLKQTLPFGSKWLRCPGIYFFL